MSPVVGPLDGSQWLLLAADLARTEGEWTAFAVTVVGIVSGGAFVRACGGFVARRDPVDGAVPSAAVSSTAVHRAVRTVGRVLVPPVIVWAWAILCTAGVLVLAPPFGVVATSLVSLVFAAVVRITAHYSEGFAETLATMLPASLLGVVLLHSVVARSVGSVVDTVGRLHAHWPLAVYGLVVLLSLEAVLRALLRVIGPDDGATGEVRLN
ncbi:MAG: hypothetical protein ABEI80_06575 [Haloplanus sp.]